MKNQTQPKTIKAMLTILGYAKNPFPKCTLLMQRQKLEEELKRFILIESQKEI